MKLTSTLRDDGKFTLTNTENKYAYISGRALYGPVLGRAGIFFCTVIMCKFSISFHVHLSQLIPPFALSLFACPGLGPGGFRPDADRDFHGDDYRRSAHVFHPLQSFYP